MTLTVLQHQLGRVPELSGILALLPGLGTSLQIGVVMTMGFVFNPFTKLNQQLTDMVLRLMLGSPYRRRRLGHQHPVRLSPLQVRGTPGLVQTRQEKRAELSKKILIPFLVKSLSLQSLTSVF